MQLKLTLAALVATLGTTTHLFAQEVSEANPAPASSEAPSPAQDGEPKDKSSDTTFGKMSNMVSDGVSASIETTKTAITRPSQWLAVDFGPASLSTTSAKEVSKQGTLITLKTLLMFDFEYFVAEGGFGLFSADLSGDFKNGKQTASVSTPITEAGARWVINHELQLGGFAQWLFGKESDFGPVEGANTNNLFIGIQAAVEPGWFEQFRGRVTLSYIFDKTIVTRNFTAVTVGIQAGLPWLDDEGRWIWENGSSPQPSH